MTVASGLPWPGPIALDDTSVYWAQFYGTPVSNGTASIVRLTPK